MSRFKLALACSVAAIAGIVFALALWNTPASRQEPAPASATKTANFVGSQACAGCHPAQYQAWQNSHHALAMQAADAKSVIAPFAGESFSAGGVTSTFSQRNGKFYVRTDGTDGKMAEFQVTHTLGIAPLQQYLIPMPDGGMQTLGIAWDARPKTQGGQRWFDLLAGQSIKAGDELHWTGRQQNWNFMCADCHTTQFKKNFDPDKRHFDSRWSELSVACEACHGFASNHIDWASHQQGADNYPDALKGFAFRFDQRENAGWAIDPVSSNAKRALPPPERRTEIETCARCHAHRSQIGDDYLQGGELLDTHVPSLLSNGLYWSDGQMRAEVYNYASFMQSKMYQKGVTCSDCHDPHSQKLRFPGNQTCLQCHAAAKYEAQAHHFHQMGSAGAQCAACHMPTTTYMSIDPRHDHAIRVPRPDLSLQRGTPNACSKCHTDKPTEWAAAWARRWFPDLNRRATPVADALYAADSNDPRASEKLLELISDPLQPAIARASAIDRLSPIASSAQLNALASANLSNHDPLVRVATINALADAPVTQRVHWLTPMLTDPVKAVRAAAARWLASIPVDALEVSDRSKLDAALQEYIAIQRFNADRPESYNNLGTLYADQGDWLGAEAVIKDAIKIDPGSTISALNLADIYQHLGREANAQALILGVIKRHPQDALAYHALGLSYLRQKRMHDALPSLRKASEIDPTSARFSTVYALALYRDGQPVPAIKQLEVEHEQHPTDHDALRTLVALCKEMRDADCIKKYAARVADTE